MVDDDFEKIVRHMFEQFFGAAFPEAPGATTFGFRMVHETPVSDAALDDGKKMPRVERIELGDKILMIIEGIEGDEGPTVRVHDTRLHVEYHDDSIAAMEFVLPYAIDTEKSFVSFRNGVAEINLVRAKSDKTSSKNNDRVLRYE